MTNAVWLTVDWREASVEMSEAQQEALTQTLLKEMRQVDAVETVERVADADAPDGSMGVGAWLLSVLTAEIPGDGIKLALEAALPEVFARLPGKPVSVTIEVDGRKLEFKDVRPKDLDEMAEKALVWGQKLKDIE